MSGTYPRPEVLTLVTRMNVGGPARLVTLLATRLEELGGIVLAGETALGEGNFEAEARAAGVHVIRVPGLRREISPLGDLRALWWLFRFLRRSRPRVLATHMAKAGALGRLAAAAAGVPIRVHTFHGHVMEGYFGSLANTMVRLVESALSALTTRFVAVSPEIADELAELGIGRGKTVIIRLGADLDHLLSAERGRLRSELQIGEAPLVGLVGRLVPIKAPELFLEAAARIHAEIPQAHFVVVGDGELRARAEQQAAALGLGPAVTFTGWRFDLACVYPDLDVLVVSSRNEGTPMSVIEAGAAGVPTVAVAVGGLPDIIAHGVNGLLVPSASAPQLAEAVVELLRDPQLRARMGAEARDIARRRYCADELLASVRSVYGLRLPDASV